MNLLSFLSVPLAHAQLALPGVVDTVKAPNTLLTFICITVFNWVFTIAIFVAIGFVLYAAFNYLSSAGDPAKITKANQTLLFAAIGIAVAIFARTVPVVIGSFIQGDLNLDPCSASTTPGPRGS